MSKELKLPQISLPIEYHTPDGTLSRYANLAVVQFGNHEFLLSFFEIWPPPIFSGQDIVAELERTKSLRAECVGRVVLAPEVMGVLIESLRTNYETYLSAKASKQQQTEGDDGI
jgi:hypothetical protein